MESRSSDRKLKPLPPDPVRHQDSAIAHRIRYFGADAEWDEDPVDAGNDLFFRLHRAFEKSNLKSGVRMTNFHSVREQDEENIGAVQRIVDIYAVIGPRLYSHIAEDVDPANKCLLQFRFDNGGQL